MASPAEAAPRGAPELNFRLFKSPARDGGWLALLAALPAILAVVQLGYLHPDENFQYLEPAFRKAFGYGIVAWEWRLGLRNWFVPLILAGILKICAGLGVTNVIARRTAIGAPFFLLQWLMLRSVFRFAARLSGKGRAAGAIAAFSLGLSSMVLLFAGRPLSETISTALLVMAIEAITRDRHRAADWFWAGAELGLAVVARYGSLPIVAVVIVWLAARRQWRALGWCIFGGAIVALALGAMDWISWGRPFASLWNYFNFNVVSGAATRIFGSSPATFYIVPFLLITPLWVWIMLPIALRRAPGRSSLWLVVLCAAVYLAMIDHTAHKEKRFLYPAMVLLSLAASVGWPMLMGIVGRRQFALFLSIGLAAGALPLLARPPFEMDLTRAIVDSAADADTTGVAVIGKDAWNAGGYFYIAKPIPLRFEPFPTPQRLAALAANREINRIIVLDQFVDAPELSGFRSAGQRGRYTMLWRNRDRGIVPTGPTEFDIPEWAAGQGLADIQVRQRGEQQKMRR